MAATSSPERWSVASVPVATAPKLSPRVLSRLSSDPGSIAAIALAPRDRRRPGRRRRGRAIAAGCSSDSDRVRPRRCPIVDRHDRAQGHDRPRPSATTTADRGTTTRAGSGDHDDQGRSDDDLPPNGRPPRPSHGHHREEGTDATVASGHHDRPSLDDLVDPIAGRRPVDGASARSSPSPCSCWCWPCEAVRSARTGGSTPTSCSATAGPWSTSGRPVPRPPSRRPRSPTGRRSSNAPQAFGREVRRC